MSTRVAGLLLLVAAWGLVLRGLFLLPPSNNPELDLEAGPAFAVDVSVYFPALALCVLLLVTLPVSVGARHGATLGVTTALTVSMFALWVLTQHPLLHYLPGLRAALWLAAGLASAGLLAFCAAYAMQVPDVDPHAENAGGQQDS